MSTRFELPAHFDGLGLYHPSGDLEALFNLVPDCGGHAFCVEVGSYAGTSALALASALERQGGGKLVCVDHWQGNQHDCLADVVREHRLTQRRIFETFCKNLGDLLWEWVYPFPATSEAASRAFADRSLDLVFIDAEHTYEAVKQDIELWLPKVKRGGIISGHDYHDNFPGVVRAVGEAFSGRPIQQAGTSVWWVHV